jgi:uncharacterized protein (TIGR03086 family)
MDVVSALEQSFDQTAKLVAGLTSEELEALSPCAGWDVRATLNHVLGAAWMFTLVNQGQVADEDAGNVIGDDAGLAVSAAAKENVASWRAPGALEGERAYVFGTFPARDAVMLNLGEVVVHNWDVAKATGRKLDIDPAVGQMVYDWAISIPLDDFREHGAFGPQVAVRASAPSSTVSSACSADDPEGGPDMPIRWPFLCSATQASPFCSPPCLQSTGVPFSVNFHLR